MTQFDRDLTGFRFIDTHRGDSLQLIAARELGDAARWIDLVNLNNLLPPFITDDPAQAGPGVVLSGKQILAPAPTAAVTSTADPEAVFETDVQLDGSGTLMTDGNDFVTVSGRANLRQALKNRIETDLGELIYRPEYGCDVRRLVGIVNGPTAGLLGAQAVKSALRQDPRVDRVTSAKAAIAGDSVSVAAEVQAVAGQSVQIQASP